MSPDGYFVLMALGLPAVIVLIALVGASLNRHDEARLLDWKPTRSPQLEAELQVGDVEQMHAALNRYRRLRGAPELSLEEITEHSWALLDEYERLDDEPR